MLHVVVTPVESYEVDLESYNLVLGSKFMNDLIFNTLTSWLSLNSQPRESFINNLVF